LRIRTQVLKYLSLWLVVLVLSSVGPSSSIRAGGSPDDDLKSRIDQIIQPLIDSQERVGVVVGVVDRRGTHTFGYGETALGNGKTPDGETLFEIGSVTKTFTALLLADLVKKGVLNLSDPIEDFLPGSVHVPSFGERKITLLDLATHTSGLPRLPSNLHYFQDPDDPNPYANYTEDMLYEFLSNYTLKREPGTEFEYSNLGVGLLGHILELVTGIDYETLVQERICNPLGMNSTRITLSPEESGRLAQGYLTYGNPTCNWDWDVLAPCGALRSTVNDLLTYVSANIGLRETNLSAAIELTHTTFRENNTLSPDWAIGLTWYKFDPGWDIPDSEKMDVICHDGDTYGYSSYVGFIKEEKIGVIVLSNTLPWPYTSLPGLEILRIVRDYQTPEADFSWFPLTSWINTSIIFNASACRSKMGNLSTYQWSFGDENITTTSEPEIDHVYSQVGNYPVTLQVSDEYGLKNTVRKSVTVTFRTDLNKDGKVNIQDISIVAVAYGSLPGIPKWNEQADIDKNGVINIVDISTVARDYGKTV
jgi:D-alanyl-D-alanine-carboxypeptidase/D-alanyl-D-alanine-endopeptidase